MSEKISWGAFWCSKCKLDHAGECPPAKVGRSAMTPAADPGFTITPKPGVLLAPIRWSYPVVPPVVGSKWVAEGQRPPDPKWFCNNSNWHYEVVSVDPTNQTAVICPINNGTGQYGNARQTHPWSAWTSQGYRTFGSRLRFVPRGTP